MWQGEHVTITSADGLRPCGGTIDFYDRYAAGVYEYWYDRSIPLDLGLSLELRTEVDEGPSGGAALSSMSAWAGRNGTDLHELVHLVTGASDGGSTPVLFEGAAEALGPGSRVDLIGPPAWPAREFAFASPEAFRSSHYWSAAKLVAFLVREYGLPTVRSAYQSIERNATAEEIEAGFVEVFGDGIYDAFEEFETTDQCPLFAWECGGEVLPVVQLPLIVGEEQGCDDPSTLGAVAEGDDNWYPYHMMTLDVGDAPMTVTMSVSDNAIMRVDDCMTTCEDVTVTSSFRVPAPGGTTMLDWELPPGRHLVTVRPRDPSQPFSASIVRAEP